MDIDNGKEFFLVLNGGVSDTCGVDWDGNVGFQTKEEASEHAKELASDGGSFTMFRCVPVEVIERGPVRVKAVSPKKS